MNKGLLKKIIVVVVLLNLCATVYIGQRVIHHEKAINIIQSDSIFQDDTNTTKKYTLYIGLNDQDSYEQIISTEEAIKLVNDICIKYVTGYSQSTNHGGWTDESGKLVQEVSLEYTFVDAQEEQIVKIMNEVLSALNQNSIMIERENNDITFYDGQEK